MIVAESLQDFLAPSPYDYWYMQLGSASALLTCLSLKRCLFLSFFRPGKTREYLTKRRSEEQSSPNRYKLSFESSHPQIEISPKQDYTQPYP